MDGTCTRTAAASSADGPVSGPSGVVVTGDAFDLIGDLADASVDLVLTSPPFWGLRSYGLQHNEGVLDRWLAAGHERSQPPGYCWYRDAGGVLGLEPYPHWYVAHLVEFFDRARSKLKPAASMWVNLGDTYFARWSSIRDNGRQGLAEGRLRRRTPSGGHLHDKQLLLIPARFAIAMQDAGWILRNDLIWAKPRVIPRPERDRLRLSHEHWFHFVLRNPKGRPSYFYDLQECEPGALDVVTVPASGGGGHSATFPADLVRPRITSACPAGGFMVDPFCGAGTALTEAIRAGRRAAGFDLSAHAAGLAKANVLEALTAAAQGLGGAA